MHLGQVGPVTARLLRRAGADEMHVAERRGLGVGGGELHPARAEPGPQELFQTRFVDGQVPGVELVNPGGVGVHTEDIETEAGHAGRVGDAQISRAEHSEAKPTAHHTAFLPRAVRQSVAETAPPCPQLTSCRRPLPPQLIGPRHGVNPADLPHRREGEVGERQTVHPRWP
jgi:hypothetical protein